MAKLVFLSLLALCYVTFVSCKPSSSSSSNPPAANPKEFVQTTCAKILIDGQANLCTKDLTPFAGEIQGDMKRLVMKAVFVTKDKVRSSMKVLKKLQLDKSATPDDGAKVVDYCILNYVQCAQQIAWAEGSLKSIIGQQPSNNKNNNKDNNNKDNLKDSTNTWLQNSQTNASACVTRMDGVKNNTFPGADAYNALDGVSTTILYTQGVVGMYLHTLPSPPTPTPQPKSGDNSDFIRDTCNKYATKGYVDQCQSDMLAKVAKDARMDEDTMTSAAVSVSIDQGNSLTEYMNNIMDAIGNFEDKNRVIAENCANDLHTAFEPYEKADEDPGKISNLMGFLEGLKACENGCLSSVRKLEVNASSAEGNVTHALQSTNIAIALVKSKGN